MKIEMVKEKRMSENGVYSKTEEEGRSYGRKGLKGLEMNEVQIRGWGNKQL